jgi:hypothetical protein
VRSTSRASRRPRIAAIAVCLAAAGAGPPPAAVPETLYSLAVVGDTGKRPHLLHPFPTLDRVSDALGREDERAPFSALLLLGDNFYPKGLVSSELVTRIGTNVAQPFCRFVELDDPPPRALTDACPPERRRHPIPLFAVLGNHDFGAPESPDLQRRVVPEYVVNWHMPAREVETVELPHGVSLVLVDSTSLLEGRDADALRNALARSAGPWRIVAAHHPLRDDAFSRHARHALADAGVTVHLWLAGHEHSLQLSEPAPPGPLLEVVSGAGSDVDPVPEDGRVRRFVAERAGFARIDLVRAGGAEELDVRMITVPTSWLPRGNPPQEATRWTIDTAGHVHGHLPAWASARPGH